jgi:hypothetical protein
MKSAESLSKMKNEANGYRITGVMGKAFRLLEMWRSHGTTLQVNVRRSGIQQDIRSTIRKIRGTVVVVGTDQWDLEVDLQGADFNGDEKSAAYLVCEFPNGDRSSFYLSRTN